MQVFSLTFSLCTGLVKKLLKATRNKKKKHDKIVMLARSKLNSIESKISETLINNQISHEDFITIINGERNYRELKESIIMMKGQEDKKQILIKLFRYEEMLSYCLKCKKILRVLIQKFLQPVITEQRYYQNLPYLIVKIKIY